MFARPSRIRRVGPLAFVLVAAAAALWLAASWPRWQSARLAAAWREELESAEADRVAALFDQLVDLGDAGLEPVVTAMASPREEVRRNAAAALGRLVDQWEVADVSARSVAAGRLSALLARHVDGFESEARQTAATFVQQMLAWSVDGEFVDRTRLVLDCEAVLLAADGANERGDATAIVSDDLQRAPPPPVDRDLASLARLPGGGLEIEPSQPPRLRLDATGSADPGGTGSASAAEPNGGNTGEPRLLFDGRGDELPPAPLPAVHPEDAAAINPTAATATATARNSPRGDAGNAAHQDAFVTGANANLHGPSTLRERSLVRLLRSEPSIAAEAERQLRAIGYGDAEITVARGISHADVDRRLRAAESLPRMAGIYPRRWLEMLLDDDDAEVRAAAIVQLATSGDTALVEWLRRRALADPDPAVRAYAERLRPSVRR